MHLGVCAQLTLLCTMAPAQAGLDSSVVAQQGKLAVLTSARQIHELTPRQAARAYPVRLRCVVTFYDPYQEGNKALFVADASGSIFVAPGSAELGELHAGSVVEVSGVTDPGGFAPIVAKPRIRLLPGTRPLPEARRVRLPLLLTGVEEGQWIELEGIVHGAEVDGMHVILTVSTGDGTLTATTVKEAGADYSSLIDSEILLRGVAVPLTDPKRRMLGSRILFPGLSTVTVEEAAPDDPFTLPVQHLSDVFRYSPKGISPHRVHVRGVVTLSWPGERVCIAEANDALCIRTRDRGDLKAGQTIDAVGFLGRENFSPELLDGLVTLSGAGVEVRAQQVSPTDVFEGGYDGQLVQIDGTLMGVNEGGDQTILLVSEAGVLFQAVLRGSPRETGSQTSKWTEGSRIRLTGVLSGRMDARMITRQEGKSRLESFQILLRSPADVRVLQSPSWWNSSHTLGALGFTGSLTLAILGWVIALRRQVYLQTMIIRRGAEEYRHMAEHDALTGLCVRRVFYERLELAIQEARIRSSSFALMMVDVDQFKCINDTMGHAAGDSILVVAAQRLQSCVRESDTVARIGGDEFIVLLRSVRGMEEAAAIASKLLKAVSAPLAIHEGDVTLTVSLGVTMFPEGGKDSGALVKSADEALYRAKSRGRNCYEDFTPETPSQTPVQHPVRPAHGLI